MSRIGPEPGQRLTSVGRRAGTGRGPGSVLIAAAAWLLALTGGGALFVSFSAQYAYILAVRRSRRGIRSVPLRGRGRDPCRDPSSRLDFFSTAASDERRSRRRSVLTAGT